MAVATSLMRGVMFSTCGKLCLDQHDDGDNKMKVQCVVKNGVADPTSLPALKCPTPKKGKSSMVPMTIVDYGGRLKKKQQETNKEHGKTRWWNSIRTDKTKTGSPSSEYQTPRRPSIPFRCFNWKKIDRSSPVVFNGGITESLSTTRKNPINPVPKTRSDRASFEQRQSSRAAFDLPLSSLRVQIERPVASSYDRCHPNSVGFEREKKPEDSRLDCVTAFDSLAATIDSIPVWLGFTGFYRVLLGFTGFY